MPLPPSAPRARALPIPATLWARNRDAAAGRPGRPMSAGFATATVAGGLMLAAVAPPLALIAAPGAATALGAPVLASGIVALLLLLPALAGLAAARTGLRRIGHRFRRH